MIYDNDNTLQNCYNQSGMYTLYKIRGNDEYEIATIKKMGTYSGYAIERIVNKRLFKIYQQDYANALNTVSEFVSNPNYIQDRVIAHQAMLIESGVRNITQISNNFVETLEKSIANKIAFLQTQFVPKSFSAIVSKYNLPELFNKDESEIYDYFYDGIIYVITYDPLIQT